MILKRVASDWVAFCVLESSRYTLQRPMIMAAHHPHLGTRPMPLGVLNKGFSSVNNNSHFQKTWISVLPRACLENKSFKAPRACLENKSFKALVGQQHSRVPLFEQSIGRVAADPSTALEDSIIGALEANEDESAVSSYDLERLAHGTSQSNKLQSGKLTVAVDIDEVLCSFVLALNTFIAERYSLNHTIAEYNVYSFDKVWNCSLSEARTRVHEFYNSYHFRKGIHPIPGAYQTLLRLTPFCHFSVVTSRQNIIRQHTIEWVERHYSGLFKEIHFGNHFALDGIARPKSEICRSFGAQILIDDNPFYALDCAENGIEALLFDYQDSYPWCKTVDTCLHPLITKAHSWQEVEQHLAARIFS